jgi:hypothetical protein
MDPETRPASDPARQAAEPRQTLTYADAIALLAASGSGAFWSAAAFLRDAQERAERP